MRIFGITIYVKNKIKRKTLSNGTERLKETLHFLINHCQPSEHFQWLTETIKLWALQKTKPMDILSLGKKKLKKKKTEQHLWNFKNRLERGKKKPSVLGTTTSICR